MKLSKMVLSLCISSVLLAGCATTITPQDEYSGFLNDYRQLRESKSASGVAVMRWIDPNVNTAKYTSVYIEPSQLYPRPQPTAQIPLNTLQGISAYFDVALKREIGKSSRVASSPGPNTLIMKPAITAVSSETEGFKPFEILPVALVAAAVNTAAGGRDQSTSIATEVVFLDADTNQVVAQLVRKGAGEDLENSKTTMMVNDVKAVLDGWASDVGQSFDSLKRGAR